MKRLKFSATFCFVIVFVYMSVFVFFESVAQAKTSDFDIMEKEQNGSLDNYTVLEDGSFAIVYDNEYICYYSQQFVLEYCVRLRSIQGATLVGSHNGSVAVVTSRYEKAYEICFENSELAIKEIDADSIKYNDAAFWNNNNVVEITSNDQRYVLKRYSLYDKLFNSKNDCFEVVDLNGNVLFSRVSNNSNNSFVLGIIIVVLVVLLNMIVVLCVIRKKIKTKRKHNQLHKSKTTHFEQYCRNNIRNTTLSEGEERES